MQDLDLFHVPRVKSIKNCCGCLCIPQTGLQQGIKFALNSYVKYEPETLKWLHSFDKRMILMQTFWGLEKA
jgi:hypothetical protein